jgi:hypothetical protein
MAGRSYAQDGGLVGHAAPMLGLRTSCAGAILLSAMSVTFDIDGRTVELSEPLAELIAENLHNFSLGKTHRYHSDVEMLARAGVDPEWTEGARALAEVMEDALVGRYEGPIPLDPHGKAAKALLRAVGLTGPASFDATSEHARLANALRDAGTQ